jgi:predicted small lipoprotein YifL
LAITVRCILLAAVTALTACGKKGPPLAPLSRVPAAPGSVQAVRIGDEAYISFTVPSANVGGRTPADAASVELYAYTGPEPPPREELLEVAERVASYPVHVPLPPEPEPVEGETKKPPIPTPPGFAQGSAAVVRETLTEETRRPTRLAGDADEVAPDEEPPPDEYHEPLSGPLVAPAAASAERRYYFVVAADRRGRPSAPSTLVFVPLDEGSGVPGLPEAKYTETTMTLSWSEPTDVRRAPPAPDKTLLPSRPLIPPPTPTRYHVFEVPPSPPASQDPYALQLPATLTPQPVAVTELAIPGPVRFGEQRCFVVRSVDAVGGATLVGPASPPGCVTPADTFPPAAPRQLVAIAGTGVVNLIWEPNTESDLAGYLVLRGTAPDGTLQRLTPSPIAETTYRDQTATPGVRYVYAVVAVDSAATPNVSELSNRVEEASRD